MNFKAPTLILLAVAVWIVSLFAAVRILGKNFSIKLPEPTKTLQTQTILEEESVVIDVVEKVSPSVVSIAIENVGTFDPFGLEQSEPGGSSGIGTGFVVSADGLILTNKHVVSEDNRKYVAIIRSNEGNEQRFDITQIHRDPFNDLALVRVKADDLKPVELGDSDSLKVGQKVIAIGNALGRFENTVTTGVVSGLGRGVTPFDPSTGLTERLEDLVQTDAAINPGNSGGPLVNSGGQVIGMNTAVASAENIGFAIKINIAKQLMSDFTSSGGRISRPFLGVRYTHITKESALANEVPEGEYVRQVVTGSSAANAGILVGDIVTEFDGKKLSGEETLSKIIRSKKVGDKVTIKVFRDGKTLDMTATLGEAPNE